MPSQAASPRDGRGGSKLDGASASLQPLQPWVLSPSSGLHLPYLECVLDRGGKQRKGSLERASPGQVVLGMPALPLTAWGMLGKIPGAAVTSNHTLGFLTGIHPSTFWGQKPQIQVSQGPTPSKGSRGGSFLCLPASGVPGCPWYPLAYRHVTPNVCLSLHDSLPVCHLFL